MQRFLSAALAALSLVACESSRPTEISGASGVDAARSAAASGPTLIIGGLEYPRGFVFGKDGSIYVAEAGTPEGNTTLGPCPEQVPPPVGPWKGGFTGRISRISLTGVRTTVIEHLPSALNGVGDVDGVSDVAFVDNKLYALMSAGCSRGHKDEPASLIRIKEHNKYDVEVNLSKWIKHHPTAHPNAGDFEPDGDWYNMAADGDRLYIVESNQGNLVTVKPNGKGVHRVADVSQTENAHVVPTGLAISRSDDDLYVGELRGFPAVPGSADVIVYEKNGKVEDRIHGFTGIVGTASDHHGNVYVVEAFNCPSATPCFPSPGSGDVVKVSHDGTRQVIAAGLSFPTSIRFGPDGALYVTNFSFGPPNLGQILRIVP